MTNNYCSPTGEHASEDEGGFFGEEMNAFSIAWIATAICVFLSTVLTIKLIYNHLVAFHQPRQQKHIVRILLMVPIYSIDSWLSFRYYWLSVYFDLIRDCYEAVVIYEFYALLLEYTGGYKRMKEVFECKTHFKLVAPLCCWSVSPKRGLLRWLSRLTLQYVLMRPLMAFIAIVLQVKGMYCPGEITAYYGGYPWVTLIGLISVTVAMYALVLFYVVVQEDLKIHNTVPKFLSIKFIIMMSFWQSIIVAGLVKINIIHDTTLWTTDNISIGVQNTLICFEMLIVAIWHYFAFNSFEFASQGPQKTGWWRSLIVCFNIVDVFTETRRSFFSRKKTQDPSLIRNAHTIELSDGASLPPSPNRSLSPSSNITTHPFASTIVPSKLLEEGRSSSSPPPSPARSRSSSVVTILPFGSGAIILSKS